MKHIGLLTLSIAMFGSCFAQETVITLSEALKQAIEKNPLVQASVLETSRQRSLKTASFELPKTDVVLIYGQYNSIQKTDNNLTLTQGIPFPGLLARQHGLNKSLITSSELKENVSKNDLAFQVKQVFNQLLYLKVRHQTLLQQDSLLADLLRIADLQHKIGEGTLLSKSSAEMQRLDVQNQKARNESDIQVALDHLRLLCQSPALIDIQGSLENFITLSVFDSTTLRQNPSLAYIDHQVEVTNWQRKVEAAMAMPDLRVGYFTQTLIGTQNVKGQERYFDSGKRFQGFQVGVSFPLWFAPHTAKIRAASIATDIARKQKESLQVSLTQQYGQAVQAFEKNRKSLSYYRESALKMAELLVIQSRLAFKSGEIDNTTLLLNLKQALTIREGYLLTLQQYNQSMITIDYLNGKI